MILKTIPNLTPIAISLVLEEKEHLDGGSRRVSVDTHSSAGIVLLVNNLQKSTAAMRPDNSHHTPPPSTLRWQILRRAIRRPDLENQFGDTNRLNQVSRKGKGGFNLIPSAVVKNDYLIPNKDVRICYTLPLPDTPKLFLRQRMEDSASLDDFEICNRYKIDNTGLVCHWPAEDVLAYYSMSHPDSFRNKRVIELGSGYGLAGFVIAMATEASEVVISDGNPQVVNYIQQNIDMNSALFGGTKVNSMMLHWDHIEVSEICGTFDMIVASDCTFFKESHKGLAHTIRRLLKEDGPSKAILFNPKRGDSLDKFLMDLNDVDDCCLHYTITETYDTEIWSRHKKFLDGDDSWSNYDPGHCYPLLVTITH